MHEIFYIIISTSRIAVIVCAFEKFRILLNIIKLLNIVRAYFNG